MTTINILDGVISSDALKLATKTLSSGQAEALNNSTKVVLRVALSGKVGSPSATLTKLTGSVDGSTFFDLVTFGSAISLAANGEAAYIDLTSTKMVGLKALAFGGVTTTLTDSNKITALAQLLVVAPQQF